MADGQMIQELAARLAVPHVVMPLGRRPVVMAPPDWQEIPERRAQVSGLEFATLSALAGYVNENRDMLEPGALSLHVASPREVRLVGRLGDEAVMFVRHQYARAIPEFEVFKFDAFMPLEQFVVSLLSRFVNTDQRAALLGVLGKVKGGDVREHSDDGVAQEVTIKTGAAFVDRAKIPSPLALVPFRTFPEVEQPESLFVLRLREGPDQPSAALFECDGGQWRLEAMLRVAEKLRELVPGVPVLA